jgi:hypothetical protein
MGRVVAEHPETGRAGHHVEVIQVVAVRAPPPGGSRAAPSPRRGPRRPGLVQAAVIGVDALESEALRRVQAVVIGLLQPRLHRAARRCRACAAGSWTSGPPASAPPPPADARPWGRRAAGCRTRSGCCCPGRARCGAWWRDRARARHRALAVTRRGAQRHFGVALRPHGHGSRGHIHRVRVHLFEHAVAVPRLASVSLPSWMSTVPARTTTHSSRVPVATVPTRQRPGARRETRHASSPHARV